MSKKKYNTPKEQLVARLVSDCKSGSNRYKKVRKGINQCDVTFDKMYALIKKQNWKCYETNIPFVIMDKRYKVEERERLNINSLNLPSIDRIDNNKGYTMDNIRIVTMAYNQMKNRYSERFVREWINLIKSNS